MTLALAALAIWNIFLTFIAFRALEQRDIASLKLYRLERRVATVNPKLLDDNNRNANYSAPPEPNEYGEDFHPV
jgi:hypothetical protein